MATGIRRHCPLNNHSLETLKSLLPASSKNLVGERGNGPPRMILLGTGFSDRSLVFRKYLCGLIIFLQNKNPNVCLVLRSCHRTLQSSSLSPERMKFGVTRT